MVVEKQHEKDNGGSESKLGVATEATDNGTETAQEEDIQETQKPPASASPAAAPSNGTTVVTSEDIKDDIRASSALSTVAPQPPRSGVAAFLAETRGDGEEVEVDEEAMPEEDALKDSVKARADLEIQPLPRDPVNRTDTGEESDGPGAYAVQRRVHFGARPHSSSVNPTTISSSASNNTNQGVAGQPSESHPESSNSNLAVAKPVEEVTISHLDLPHALEHQDSDLSSKSQATKKEEKIVAIVTCIIVCSIIAIIVGILVARSGGDDTDLELENNTQFPSAAPTMSPEASILSLLPDHTIRAINRGGTPQEKAFQWLLEDPLFETLPDSRIIQRFALVTFYYATDGPNWFNATNWLNYDYHECDWHMTPHPQDTFDVLAYRFSPEELYVLLSAGACEESHEYDVVPTGNESQGIYRNLRLFKNNLEGTLPDELYLLTNLYALELFENRFESGLSSHIGNLRELHTMDFVSSELPGTIPTEIGLLSSNLYSLLGLFNNRLTGTIPSELGLLTSLEEAYLASNQLTGSLPTELGQISMVNRLYLEDISTLEGTLPSEFGQLTLLTSLYLWGSHISGTIPTEMGLLSSLLKFYIDTNLLTGTIPTELGQLEDVVNFTLYENMLSGPIPLSLGNLTAVNEFLISDNQITGSIPSEVLTEFQDLVLFSAKSNLLTGQIPTEFGALENLTGIDLEGNEFDGPIPSELGNLQNMTTLRLSSNDLEGPIPDEIADLVMGGSLVELAVTNNPQLSGIIPESLCILPSLEDGEFSYNCSDILCGCDCSCRNATETTYLNATDTLLDIIFIGEEDGNETDESTGNNITTGSRS